MSPREAADARRLDLVAAANWYRLTLGWPVNFDAAHRRLILHTGDALDAITLPNELAGTVVQDLERNLQAGPVCIDTTKAWWTVLTEPCTRAHADIAPELRSQRVHAVPRGGQAIVAHPQDTPRWRRAPEPDGSLPPWTTVITAANRAIRRPG
ncbi:hypothetical protein AB0L88_33190 [Saccharopolyspora shandongensis]|uniref:hypothetical protein n=1 Tax=Saccharopolyspora shandongensis TaxID=418495 RepID=UPI003415C0DE